MTIQIIFTNSVCTPKKPPLHNGAQLTTWGVLFVFFPDLLAEIIVQAKFCTQKYALRLAAAIRLLKFL